MRQRSIVIELNTKLARIEQRSRKDPQATFNNLGRALDMDLLRACFHSLDAKKAVGVDGESILCFEELFDEIAMRVRKPYA